MSGWRVATALRRDGSHRKRPLARAARAALSVAASTAPIIRIRAPAPASLNQVMPLDPVPRLSPSIRTGLNTAPYSASRPSADGCLGSDLLKGSPRAELYAFMPPNRIGGQRRRRLPGPLRGPVLQGKPLRDNPRTAICGASSPAPTALTGCSIRLPWPSRYTCFAIFGRRRGHSEASRRDVSSLVKASGPDRLLGPLRPQRTAGGCTLNTMIVALD